MSSAIHRRVIEGLSAISDFCSAALQSGCLAGLQARTNRIWRLASRPYSRSGDRRCYLRVKSELAGGRGLALLLLPAAMALPAWPAQRVTVQQLENAVAADRAKADKDAAQQLSGMELAERLTTARLEKLKAALPGEQSRQALLAVADASAFLSLPGADIPADATPNSATQGHIMSLADDFVMATLPNLPNFLATRTTTRFRDLKLAYLFQEPTFEAKQRFQFVDKTSAGILYRDGREIVETEGSKNAGQAPTQTGSTSWGEFGLLLGYVMADVLKGKIGWGHWEQGAAGPIAVFRYAVAEGKSHYIVKYCCDMTSDGAMHEFKAVPPYHGEIAVDPKTGTVLRLVVKSDLKPNQEISRADVAVEYGPVDIGGRSYICPINSVSITTASFVVAKGIKYVGTDAYYDDIVGTPKVTSINDVVFRNYHQFRSEMRILPEDSSGPTENKDGNKPAGAPANPQKTPPTQ
jgi:hypothetical protein